MAKPGENVLLKFQINVEDIQKGYILCSPTSICPSVVLIKVQMALVEMLEHRPVFSPGTRRRSTVDASSVIDWQ